MLAMCFCCLLSLFYSFRSYFLLASSLSLSLSSLLSSSCTLRASFLYLICRLEASLSLKISSPIWWRSLFKKVNLL